jgi:hypothetical protein
LVRQRFFCPSFFSSILGFLFFVFFGCKTFMNVLINLLLPLKGCVVDNVSSHAGIGGDFYHF